MRVRERLAQPRLALSCGAIEFVVDEAEHDVVALVPQVLCQALCVALLVVPGHLARLVHLKLFVVAGVVQHAQVGCQVAARNVRHYPDHPRAVHPEAVEPSLQKVVKVLLRVLRVARDAHGTLHAASPIVEQGVKARPLHVHDDQATATGGAGVRRRGALGLDRLLLGHAVDRPRHSIAARHGPGGELVSDRRAVEVERRSHRVGVGAVPVIERVTALRAALPAGRGRGHGRERGRRAVVVVVVVVIALLVPHGT
ncbi:MAG: hypothetical protein CL844_03820 [Crocinitomicaceae bacterium]|nr:hypothetical protein [Crocinitomicaceae bacterium]